MKLSPHAFSRYWDVHAWVGVVAGLVLYVMFLAGSITLFHEELEQWQEPFAQRTQAIPLQDVLDHALSGLARHKVEPAALWLYLPEPGTPGAPRLGYNDPATDDWRMSWIDVESGTLVAERERLAEFLYGLHFLYHDAIGDWLYYGAGLLAVAFLLALATGVLIHLKDLVRQFHQFRPEKSPRVVWSDMHKVLGVMGLPFQTMYAYTGALIVLAPLILRGFVGPVFAGDQERATRAVWASEAKMPNTPGLAARVLPLDALARRALDIAPRLSPSAYQLVHHGHENAVVEVHGTIEGTPRAQGSVRLREVDGGVLHVDLPGKQAAIGVVWNWIFGLHFARFGGHTLRFVFLFLGLAGCATILTGNWIWLARRHAQRGGGGHRVLSRLTVGFGAGSLVSIAAMFLASRLLPLTWRARGTAEELCFVVTLCACIAWALNARSELAVWWQQLGLAGIALLPVPLLALRTSQAGLFGKGPSLATVVGVDAAILITGLSLCAAAIALRSGASHA